MTAVSTHIVRNSLFDYCESLAREEVKIEPIPQIFFDIYSECTKLKEKYSQSFHSAVFRIVDDNSYLLEFDEKSAKNK